MSGGMFPTGFHSVAGVHQDSNRRQISALGPAERLSRTLFLLLEREGLSNFAGHFIFRRKFSSMHKHRPEVTPHADVTSYKAKQEQDADPVPQSRGVRGVNPGAPTIRAVLQADSSHLISVLSVPGQASESLDAASSILG